MKEGTRLKGSFSKKIQMRRNEEWRIDPLVTRSSVTSFHWDYRSNIKGNNRYYIFVRSTVRDKRVDVPWGSLNRYSIPPAIGFNRFNHLKAETKQNPSLSLSGKLAQVKVIEKHPSTCCVEDDRGLGSKIGRRTHLEWFLVRRLTTRYETPSTNETAFPFLPFLLLPLLFSSPFIFRKIILRVARPRYN